MAGERPTIGYARIVPVQPLGPTADPYPPGTTIDGNTIRLSQAGTRVWFDVYVGGWSPIEMQNVQGTIDHTTFASGSGSPLTVASLLCNGNAECAAAFGPTSRCTTDCEAAFFDASRSTLPPLIAAQTDTPNISFGWVPLPGNPGVEDFGMPFLTASFVLDVPPVPTERIPSGCSAVRRRTCFP